MPDIPNRQKHLNRGGYHPKKPGNDRPLSSSMARIAQRSLTANPDEVRAYRPKEIDLRIAEAIVNGASTQLEIATVLKVGNLHIAKVMGRAVRNAWICAQVRKVIEFQRPLIEAGLFMKARKGDVRAAELFLRYCDAPAEKHLHLHTTLGFNPEKMSDEDLEAVIKSKGAIIDVPAEVKKDE